jgi:hypothetical protein
MAAKIRASEQNGLDVMPDFFAQARMHANMVY